MTTKIYVLTEPDGRIRYVGKTIKSLKRRFGLHLTESRMGAISHRCNWIRSLLSKGFLPLIQFVGEVGGNGCREEVAWIKYFRDEGLSLVNGTDGGDGVLGYKYSSEDIVKKKAWRASPETRKRMSDSRKGVKRSLEFKAKMSLLHTGKKLSAETCKRISEGKMGSVPWNKGKHLGPSWNKGKPCSEKTKQKLSDALKGRIISLETRRKIGLSHLGQKRSEASKLKMSLAAKKREALKKVNKVSNNATS